MNIFDINVKLANFLNSRTDRTVPCNYCKAEDIAACITLCNAMNGDLTKHCCRDSQSCNTPSGGDAFKGRNSMSIYEYIDLCDNISIAINSGNHALRGNQVIICSSSHALNGILIPRVLTIILTWY